MQVEFEKNDIKHTFNLRDTYKETNYLEFSKDGLKKYLDLTSDVSKTSTTDIEFDKGISKYIRTKYSTFNKATGQAQQVRIGQETIDVNINTEGYINYTIGVNCNFSLRHVEDRSGSSTNNNYQWDGKLNNYNGSYFTDAEDSVRPMPLPNNPADIDDNNIENSEIIISGLVSDINEKFTLIKQIDFNYAITSHAYVYIKRNENTVTARFQFVGGSADRRYTLLSYNGIIGIKIYD